MILIINICKEKLHYLEFVKPICDILDNNKIKYFACDYRKVNEADLKKASKVIICGTSLYDNDFVKNIGKFKWITSFDKPVLGICGGMQIIGLLFGGKIQSGSEIGYYNENFNFEFLGLFENCDVYHLHNNFIDFVEIGFRIYCSNGIISTSHSDLVSSEKKISKSEYSQAVKHREKEIYGVLFHPEVRNKGLIIKFCSL